MTAHDTVSIKNVTLPATSGASGTWGKCGGHGDTVCSGATTEGFMDLDEARAVLRAQHRAVLSTMRADGTPQMSPVVATIDPAGRVTVSSREGLAKVRNLRRDPRAWLCVLPDEFFGRWIQVEGTTEIVELPDALPLLEEYYRSISGEHENWDEYRDAMRAERRVVLRISLTRAGPS